MNKEVDENDFKRTCRYCGRVFKNFCGKNGHEPYCSCNPNKLPAWNKGLTKETNEAVARNVAGMWKTMSNPDWKKLHPAWNKGLTKEANEAVARNAASLKKTKNDPEWRKAHLERIYKKYDGKHFTQTAEYKKHMGDCIEAKYGPGIRSTAHVPEIARKVFEGSHKCKTYTFPSGREVRIRGYEPFALDSLLKKYPERDLIVEVGEMPEFYYVDNAGKRHRYYPDIYIKSENKIVEVKSDYTITQNKEINVLKYKSVVDSGCSYECWVLKKTKKDAEILEVINDLQQFYEKIE